MPRFHYVYVLRSLKDDKFYTGYTNNLRRLGWGDDDFADGGSDRLVDAIVLWRSSRSRAIVYLAVTGAAGVVAGVAGWWIAQWLS